MPNAHSGISHPFSASHDSAAQVEPMPLEAMALAREELQAMQETYTPWIPHDAALEDKMYPRWDPSKYDKCGYARASDAVDDAYNVAFEYHMEKYTGTAGDVVMEHAFEQHTDVKPWQAKPDAAEPYYQVAVRPLDNNAFKNFFGAGIPGLLQHWDHMQMMRNNGDNFGLFNDSQVRADDSGKLGQYLAMAPQYRAEYIDKARAILDAQWADYVERYMAVDYHDWWSNSPKTPQRYSYSARNCQHYIKHVLDLAEELAMNDCKKLIVQ